MDRVVLLMIGIEVLAHNLHVTVHLKGAAGRVKGVCVTKWHTSVKHTTVSGLEYFMGSVICKRIGISRMFFTNNGK